MFFEQVVSQSVLAGKRQIAVVADVRLADIVLWYISAIHVTVQAGTQSDAPLA